MTNFTDNKDCPEETSCPYHVGQIVKQFYPINYEAEIVLTKTSFDVIIGLASPTEENINPALASVILKARIREREKKAIERLKGFPD